MVLRPAPTPCRPSRVTSFPSFGGTTRALVVLARESASAPTLAGAVTRSMARGFRVETTRSPRFLGSPPTTRPARRPRWDLRARPSSASMLPSASRTASAPTTQRFGAQSHGSWRRCLRFAARVTPGPRKTRFRLVASLGRAGFDPQDSTVSFRSVPTTSSRLILAQPTCCRPRPPTVGPNSARHSGPLLP